MRELNIWALQLHSVSRRHWEARPSFGPGCLHLPGLALTSCLPFCVGDLKEPPVGPIGLSTSFLSHIYLRLSADPSPSDRV